MDRLEGHPAWSRREVMTLADGGQAWTYLPPIPAGVPRYRITEHGLPSGPAGAAARVGRREGAFRARC